MFELVEGKGLDWNDVHLLFGLVFVVEVVCAGLHFAATQQQGGVLYESSLHVLYQASKVSTGSKMDGDEAKVFPSSMHVPSTCFPVCAPSSC